MIARLVLLLILLAPAAHAGPWTHEAGHGYGKAWISLLPGVGFPSDDPEVGNQLYGYYQETFVGLYGELGVAKRFTLFAHWTPVRTFLLVDPLAADPQVFASVGEPMVGARGQLVQAGRFALSVEGSIRVPTESNAPVADVHAITDDNPLIGQLRTALGVWEMTAGLSAGLGFDRFYLAASVSATNRTAGFDSYLDWTVEGGTKIGKRKRWDVRARIAGHHALKDGTADTHASPSGIGNGTEYLAFTLEGDYLLRENLWFGISLGGGLGYVKLQTGGPQLAFSISTRF